MTADCPEELGRQKRSRPLGGAAPVATATAKSSGVTLTGVRRLDSTEVFQQQPTNDASSNDGRDPILVDGRQTGILGGDDSHFSPDDGRGSSANVAPRFVDAHRRQLNGDAAANGILHSGGDTIRHFVCFSAISHSNALQHRKHRESFHLELRTDGQRKDGRRFAGACFHRTDYRSCFSRAGSIAAKTDLVSGVSRVIHEKLSRAAEA